MSTVLYKTDDFNETYLSKTCILKYFEEMKAANKHPAITMVLDMVIKHIQEMGVVKEVKQKKKRNKKNADKQ